MDKQALIDLKAKVKAGTVDIADESVLLALPKPAFAYTLFYQSYHGSVDAALSLLEAVLPGWKWEVGGCDLGCDAVLEFGEPGYTEYHYKEEIDIIPARALLLAILSALISQA